MSSRFTWNDRQLVRQVQDEMSRRMHACGRAMVGKTMTITPPLSPTNRSSVSYVYQQSRHRGDLTYIARGSYVHWLRPNVQKVIDAGLAAFWGRGLGRSLTPPMIKLTARVSFSPSASRKFTTAAQRFARQAKMARPPAGQFHYGIQKPANRKGNHQSFLTSAKVYYANRKRRKP